MNEKEAWIAFSTLPQIGPVRFSLLLSFFGSARKAWGAPLDALLKVGLRKDIAARFDAARQNFDPVLYLKQLEKEKIRTISLKEKEYPSCLREIQDPPLLLHVKGRGDLGKTSRIGIAIVGARRMTSYGREVTKRLVAGLVRAQVTVVSGLAEGIDSVAHETAIGLGGKTIAVLGHGLDFVYPPGNKKLAEKILVKNRGLLVSEYPLGYAPLAENFPRRNRIVSGLSQGVVVVEGAKKSGTLLTASAAASQGREVFAVPGPVTSPTSAAPHFLLKNGAKLVENAEDILEDL